MQFLSSFCLSLAYLAVSVRANLHPDCVCTNGGNYNTRLSSNACTLYNNAGYQWGGSNFNATTGNCDALAGADIAGKEWEASCKSIASAGFPCADGVGTCFVNPDDVRGKCTN